jgi:NADH-ubiquinone oxidoreductase chain 4
MPVFAALFFVTTAFNMAVPLSLNWIGEALSLAGIFQKSPVIGLLGASSIVLSACYSIFLFNRLAFGAYSQYLSYTTDISRREYMVMLPLLLVALNIYIHISNPRSKYSNNFIVLKAYKHT